MSQEIAQPKEENNKGYSGFLFNLFFAFIVSVLMPYMVYQMLFVSPSENKWEKVEQPKVVDSSISIKVNDSNKELIYAQNEKIYNFLITLNPVLHEKIIRIENEITVSKKKIEKLYFLHKKYPQHAKMINFSLEKWELLLKQLEAALKEIDFKVEGAFVAYKINEIQGVKQFSATSKNILAYANATLANAEATKATLEEQINE